MNNKLILTIDPGEKGGIAVLDCGGNPVEVVKMPDTPHDALSVLKKYKGTDIRCFIEKVGGIPGQSATASFNFGKGYGELLMALLALELPTTLITPQRWQNALGLRSLKGETKTKHKNRIKAWSQRRFPGLRITLHTSDALAIAAYVLDYTNINQNQL